MDTSLLQECLKNNNIEKAIEIVENLGKKKVEESVPILISLLLETDNIVLRNSIAIALSDIGNEAAVIPIISLLKDPKTIGSRGTLLYALEPFDIIKHVDEIFEMLFDDYYEVNIQSLELLKNSFSKISDNEKHTMKEKVKKKLKYHQDKLNFLTYVLNELE